MRKLLTIGIMTESDAGQTESIVRVCLPIDSLADEAQVLSAIRRCRMQLERLSPVSEAVSQPTPAQAHNRHSNPRLATTKQINAISAMAKRQGVELDRMLHDRFGASSLSALTIGEASSLIDELKGSLQSV